MSVKRYGIYLARFQFIESNDYKIRPVVIVSQPRGEHKIVLVVPLSSQPDRQDIDIALMAWQDSGLAKPTVARVHRLTALLGSNVLELIGQLDSRDVDMLKQALRQVFEL
jgi:mRNA-degrading endonuclease toxin of MazEF toxin-antitoxin module